MEVLKSGKSLNMGKKKEKPQYGMCDKKVREVLGKLGEPMSLFEDETARERSDRLRLVMAHHPELKFDVDDIDEICQVDGTDDLLMHVRRAVTKYSISWAYDRLRRKRKRSSSWDLYGEDFDLSKVPYNWDLDVSEVADDRALTGCSFSSDGDFLATSSLSGKAKIWNTSTPHKELILVSTLEGHTDRVIDVAFRPSSDAGGTRAMVATASADSTAKLWSTVDHGAPLVTCSGHTKRLGRLAFHPSGNYLGTTSFDETWRLWDVETGRELFKGGGHESIVYGMSFHPDGSLVATSGLDSMTRVWDLRIGKDVMRMSGDGKAILGVAFSPNGYQLATSEGKHCVVQDFRQREPVHIHAHSKLVSEVRFEPRLGSYLVTTSYDKTAKVWSTEDFRLMKTLSGHDAAVTSSDMTGDGQKIATVAHDRTVRLWSSSCEIERCLNRSS